MEYRDRDDLDGKDVLLDGNTFTGCTFRNCRIIFGATAPIHLGVNNFHENVQWAFSDSASDTLQFLSALYHSKGEGGRQIVEQTFENIRRGLYQRDAS